jgi:excisionase family DNA binding protein
MAIQTRLVTVKELSSYLRVHPATIYKLLKRGEIPGFKLGSDWRFNLEAINRWRLSQAAQSNEIPPSVVESDHNAGLVLASSGDR